MAWLFVVVQFALLAALWLTPTGNLWSRPSWLGTAADVLFVVGLGYATAAALWLRRALTALPLPRAGGELCTSGPYRFSRHPIYLGVLAACVAMVARRAHLTAIVLFIALVGFFTAKARWEESRLVRRYPSYRQYQASTGRILPRP